MHSKPPHASPRRYHPALVILHWLLALLVVVALATGTFVLKEMPNDSIDKIGTSFTDTDDALATALEKPPTASIPTTQPAPSGPVAV